MNSSNYLGSTAGASSRHGVWWWMAAMQGSRASLSHHKIIFPDTRVVYSNAPAMSGGEQEADAFGRLSLRPQWRRAGAEALGMRASAKPRQPLLQATGLAPPPPPPPPPAVQLLLPSPRHQP